MADQNIDGEGDAALVRRIAARQDDNRALAVMISRYWEPLRGILTGIYDDLIDGSEYEEALNRTFFNVWRSAHQFDPDKAKFKTWLITIGQNAVIDVQRGEAEHRATPGFEPGHEPPDPCGDGELDDPIPERVQLAYEIIEKEFRGTKMKVVAESLLAFGDDVNYERLARRTGSKLDSLYVMVNTIKERLRTRILEIENARSRLKGES